MGDVDQNVEHFGKFLRPPLLYNMMIVLKSIVNLKFIKRMFLHGKGQPSEMIDGLIKLNYSFHFTVCMLLTIHTYLCYPP